MEYSLGEIIMAFIGAIYRLNPYSNGILTWQMLRRLCRHGSVVLILILMEYSLGFFCLVKRCKRAKS